MIIDKHLIAWLPFDSSTNADKSSGSQTLSWNSAGTLNSTIVFHGSNSNSYSGSLTRAKAYLGGQDFTIDTWVYLRNPTNTTSKCGIISVVDGSSATSASYMLMQFCHIPKTGKLYFDCSSDGTCDSSKLVQTELSVTFFDQWVHVAIVYDHNNSLVKLYLNGQSQAVYSLSSPIARQQMYVRIGVGRNDSGASYGYFYCDEFTLYDDKALYSSNFNPPASTFYDEPFSIILDADTARQFMWRYENPGRADLLTVQTGTTVTDLPESSSLTGVGFYQPNRTACFGIDATNELWMRCDIFTTNSYASGDRIRIYSEDNNGVNGFCTQSTTSNKYQIWHNGTSLNGNNYYSKNKLRSFWMHMRSGVTDGLIEVVTGSDSFSYTGNVNAGDDFANLYIQMDGSNIYVSNLIISNKEVDIGEGAQIVYFDTERIAAAGTSITLSVDAERHLTADTSLELDTSRSVNLSITEDFDTERVMAGAVAYVDYSVDAERQLTTSASIDFDTSRDLTNDITLVIDTSRSVTLPIEEDFDTSVSVVRSTVIGVDVERHLIRTEAFDCDLWRNIPYAVTDNDSTIQNVTISLQEQQLTDNISFTHISDAIIMGAVDLQFLDYATNGKIEETSTRGILQTCKCTCDVDQILYQQMAYTIPEEKWEWTPEYDEAVDDYNATHEDEINKVPSAPASAHIRSIANSLGKNVSLLFDDYISTMSTEVQSGTNYAGLISELFGWTSRLPQRMINCYLRGDTIYVVQRGKEEHTVVLDNLCLTVHTITKKIVRTTWGSDPKNQTEVKPLYDSWVSSELTPFPPEQEEPLPGDGVSLDDDGLVRQTTVTHGSDTVVTTYEYIELDGGKKFLSKETAITYTNGTKADEVVTTHEPVSYGQSQITSTDSDSVLGSVVSPSDFDDRMTPYDYQGMMSGSGSGGYREGWLGGYDSNGHYYPYVYDAGGNRYLLTGFSTQKKKVGEYTHTIPGNALIDTSFPVDGDALLEELTDDIRWLDRKTEESVTLELYDYNHVIDFNDKISWHGNIYYLRSNSIMITESIRNKQTLEFVRWY